MKHFYELRRARQGDLRANVTLGYFSGYGFAKGFAMDVSNGQTMGKWRKIGDAGTLQVADTEKYRYLLYRLTFSDPD